MHKCTQKKLTNNWMWYNRWVAIKTLVRYKEQWFNKTGEGYVRSRMEGW